MERARVMKLSSTFRLFLTEVERYFILWELHHSITSDSLTLRYKSFLLPRSIITALSALVRQRSYHCSFIFLNDFSEERSKTIKTPWHPLKYVETMDLYFSWPAVSQIYNLAGLSLRLIFLILKSMVVTWVSFSARNYPSVNLQNRAVLPTLLSPMIMILQRFQSLFVDRQRSQIMTTVLLFLGYVQITTIYNQSVTMDINLMNSSSDIIEIIKLFFFIFVRGDGLRFVLMIF